MIMLLVGTSPANFCRIRACGGVLFLSQDTVIIYGNSWTGNNVNFWTFKGGRNTSDIPFLSVREEQGAKLILDLTGRHAEVVLDPSLLLRKEQWVAFLPKDELYNNAGKEYIFCYLLGSNPEHVSYAENLSRHTGLPLVTVESKNKRYGKDFTIIAPDPLQFLRVISQARYIITDSFHGVTFSILLEKNFGVFKRFRDDDPISQNSRIYNILGKVALEERLISVDTPFSFFSEERIDYKAVADALSKERAHSLNFLRNSLFEACKEHTD